MQPRLPGVPESADLGSERRASIYMSGITFSGGDPLHEANEAEITALAKEIREQFPAKTIWLYTGYEWPALTGREILNYIDVLVDGRWALRKRAA